jgi:hypothetical protein
MGTNILEKFSMIGLKANAEKTKYMLLCHYQIAGQNHDIKTAYWSSKNVAQFKHLSITLTNKNVI